ncbi:hypothetical protein [Subtercola boreus]|uniref:hypothetical protein n=1 Tax=Subtercola boreus TaxID=120213 RepID=UPI0011C02722|nr:hypothetical protein [Subtercola boreus]
MTNPASEPRRQSLPAPMKAFLIVLGVILFIVGVVMIFSGNNWGILVAILGVTPITAAFQKYKPRSE